jgi:hypothetical protein
MRAVEENTRSFEMSSLISLMYPAANVRPPDSSNTCLRGKENATLKNLADALNSLTSQPACVGSKSTRLHLAQGWAMYLCQVYTR